MGKQFAGMLAVAAVITAMTIKNLTIGIGGTAITKHVSVQQTINPVAIGAYQATSSPITVTGALAGDTVIVTRPAVWLQTTSTLFLNLEAYVSATNTVVLWYTSATNTTIDAATGTVRIDTFSH